MDAANVNACMDAKRALTSTKKKASERKVCRLNAGGGFARGAMIFISKISAYERVLMYAYLDGHKNKGTNEAIAEDFNVWDQFDEPL